MTQAVTAMEDESLHLSDKDLPELAHIKTSPSYEEQQKREMAEKAAATAAWAHEVAKEVARGRSTEDMTLDMEEVSKTAEGEAEEDIGRALSPLGSNSGSAQIADEVITVRNLSTSKSGKVFK